MITFDLTGYDLEGYNKFIPYYLHPDGVYTVAVSPSSFRTKISVGSLGPGSDRLRYRLAKAVLELTDGVLVGADGERIAVDSLADATWGSLW